MSTTYESFNWKFDSERWAEVLRRLPEGERRAAIELSGLTDSGWYHWLNPDKSNHYLHPGMLNFLNVCNLLNLTPTDFFCLDVKEL